MVRALLIVFLFLLSTGKGFSQNSFRFKSDITTKVKNIDNTFQYTKGHVTYDRNAKKIIYKISFPQKETYVSVDTLVYKYVNDQLASVLSNPLKPEYSIYHFILNNDISDFGLKKSSYTVANTEKVDGLIITKWVPPSNVKSAMGNIVISTKDKRLNSVLIYSSAGVLLNRQIYKKYQSINGAEIPTEILSVTYIGATKKYQIVEFHNVIINEAGNDAAYSFNIPTK